MDLGIINSAVLILMVIVYKGMSMRIDELERELS